MTRLNDKLSYYYGKTTKKIFGYDMRFTKDEYHVIKSVIDKVKEGDHIYSYRWMTYNILKEKEKNGDKILIGIKFFIIHDTSLCRFEYVFV